MMKRSHEMDLDFWRFLSADFKTDDVLLGILHDLEWAKNTLLVRPCQSVCRVFPTGVGNLPGRG
jgi:hypothetical protein